MNKEMTLNVDLDEIINELEADLSWQEEARYKLMVDTSISVVALVQFDSNDFHHYEIDAEDVVCELCRSVRRKFEGVIFDSEKWMNACARIVLNWDESGDITTELIEDQCVADEYRAESRADDERMNHG